MNNLREKELLDFIHFAIQEALNGNNGELDSALEVVEYLRDGESNQ